MEQEKPRTPENQPPKEQDGEKPNESTPPTNPEGDYDTKKPYGGVYVW